MNGQMVQDDAQMLVARIRSDRNSLAKAITIVENNFALSVEILRKIQEHLGHAHVIGVTGPPGVGKSTLIDVCITEIRRLEKSVAVLAVDPSSHFSGGAILGDRIRMAQHTADDQVFIRSVAARGHLGGISATALNIIHLFDAAKWDVILVETVGAGQSEIDIAALADTTVVVESPGLGDEVQAIKAGLLEIADIVVVNKADHPNADVTVSELTLALTLREFSNKIPVLKTCATQHNGIDELVAEIVAHKQKSRPHNQRDLVHERARVITARLIGESISRQFRNSDCDAVNDIAKQVQTGTIDAEKLAELAMRSMVSNFSSLNGSLS